MKKSLFAGAAVAAATIGLPILAWAADPTPIPAGSPASTPAAPAPASPAATTTQGTAASMPGPSNPGQSSSNQSGTGQSSPGQASPGQASPGQASPGQASWRAHGGPWQRIGEGRIGPGGMAGNGMPEDMSRGMMHPGMMMRQAWMRRHAMWHQGWHHHWRQKLAMNPQQRCEGQIARRAAMRAYVAARLDFTSAQLPLWQKLQAQFDTADMSAHQLCASLPTAPQPQTFLDRVNRREQVLSARLAALKTVLPDMTALYQALTPQQQALVDHPFRRQQQ